MWEVPCALSLSGRLPGPPAAPAHPTQHGGAHEQPPDRCAAVRAEQVPCLPDPAPLPGLQHIRRGHQGVWRCSVHLSALLFLLEPTTVVMFC
jgi:hypothetical protein